MIVLTNEYTNSINFGKFKKIENKNLVPSSLVKPIFLFLRKRKKNNAEQL